MTKTSIFVRRLSAAAAGATVLMAASSASAERVYCEPNDQTGFAFLARAFAWPDGPRCVPVYQGDYMVNRGPVYSGPAVIAPQPTYAPAPTAVGYPYVSGYPAERARPRFYLSAPSHRVDKRLAPR